MPSKTVGNAQLQYDDANPFAFTLSEAIGAKGDDRITSIKCDFSVLIDGYTDRFIYEFRDLIIKRSHTLALRTVRSESARIVLLLRVVINQKLFDSKVDCINEIFLLSLYTIYEKISSSSLAALTRLYKNDPYSELFATDVRLRHFPLSPIKKGDIGNRIDRILNTVLTRGACVDILSQSEDAFEEGRMEIGCFAFVNLAFSVFCRPDSYRRIRVSDLVCDNDRGEYFIYIPPAKTKVRYPRKICYQLNSHVGMLLQMQRQSVIDTYGVLVNESEIENLALFPSRYLNCDKSSWWSEHSSANQGEYESSGSFCTGYINPIRRVVQSAKNTLTTNALRHTIGTQLAVAGCSSQTIMAVLKHASSTTVNAYVDIAFHGFANVLSDSLEPAFQSGFPVYQVFCSKADITMPKKAVFAENILTGEMALTGECGKTIQCDSAPLSCYTCSKFIPCYDADHRINLDIVEREIQTYKHAGGAYQHLLRKAGDIKQRIIQVIAMCEQHKPETEMC